MLALCAVAGSHVAVNAGTAPAVCGNDIVEQNEICDGQPCCTSTCVMAPNGTACGAPAGPCRLPSACFDFSCFAAATLPDMSACDDGDACTVGDFCRGGNCIPGTLRCQATPATGITQPRLGDLAPGTPAVVIDCIVPGGAGGTCSASTFLPTTPAVANAAAVAASSTDLSCDFTRQITRSVSRPINENGLARLKLKLNKLARRLIRKLPASNTVALTVCTKVDFPNGESVTLVDVVNAAR